MNTLWSGLRGAASEDYDAIFKHMSPTMLPEFRARLQEIVSNLDRIIKRDDGIK
ncbi:hypothetical protein HZA86_05170 [Candidatus Uhrbacteria bacterium]|nr:hypothetical protein [Candidatus Uhrbacteria bacterium]